MKQLKTITVSNNDELFEQIRTDAAHGFSTYHVMIELGNHHIELEIDSSPGGGGEGGFGLTRIDGTLPHNPGFHFNVYPKDVINQLGKFLGLQDVDLGYPEFHDATIFKTNNAEKAREVFADAEVRSVFTALSGYSLKVKKHDEKHGDHLELNIQRALVNIPELRRVFNAFLHVMDAVAPGK